MTNTLADEELMFHVRNGTGEMLGVLFGRYHSPLFNFYCKLTGDRSLPPWLSWPRLWPLRRHIREQRDRRSEGMHQPPTNQPGTRRHGTHGYTAYFQTRPLASGG